MSDIYSQHQFPGGFISFQTRPCYQREREIERERSLRQFFLIRWIVEKLQNVHSAIVISKNDILDGVQQLISSEMRKRTENQRAFADMQISKMADLSSDYKF